MKEQELQNIIKTGVKSPSDDFTDKVMNEIITLHSELEPAHSWKFRLLLFACSFIVVLSLFVRIPEIQFLNHTIEFSPVITPILSVIFLFIVFQQLNDLRSKKIEIRKYNVVQHAV